MINNNPIKVVLLACGCYNPPTNMHLRMFEIARDHLHRMGNHVVIGGLISPTHDAYGKKDLEKSSHRLSMIKLALQTSDWVKVSDWECKQENWSRTRVVLQYYQNKINSFLNSNDYNNLNNVNEDDLSWMPECIKNGCEGPVQVKLLCGGDLLESFGTPGLWHDDDISAIVGQHGLVVITRENSNPLRFIYESDLLTKYMSNIIIVTEWIRNEVSSTRIRRALRRAESVKYLIPDNVINYIHKHELYGVKSDKYLDFPSLNHASVFLTPSPCDVSMKTPSPVSNRCANICSTGLFGSHSSSDNGCNNNNHLAIDTVDTVVKNNVINTLKRPGQAVKIITEESGKHKIIKSSLDLQKEVREQTENSLRHELKASKSCTNFNMSTEKRDEGSMQRVQKESHTDLKASKSCDENLIKFIFTRHGIQVISDFETIV